MLSIFFFISPGVLNIGGVFNMREHLKFGQNVRNQKLRGTHTEHGLNPNMPKLKRNKRIQGIRSEDGFKQFNIWLFH